MDVLDEKEEIKRLKVLQDIYVNENEQLKYEYRVLYDKFALLQEEIKTYKNDHEEFQKYKYSFMYKLQKKLCKCYLYRGLRKIKHVFKKKGV